jgi:GAF domain-containing protein
MGTDETASPQRSSDAELETAKRALAACQSEVHTLLARQAASIDVLKTISASPDDPQPVFEMIARRASELCKSDTSAVLEYDGALVHLRALGGLESTTRAAYARMFPMALTREMSFGSAIIDGEAVHITDYSRHIAQNITNSALRAAVEQINPTVVLAVPLLREGRAIGAVNLARFADGRAFDDAEITLVESFAEQAVIAITSAQTRRALAARNNEYGERIEQQSATIDVLKAMATLASDRQPVFELITARARDLCGSLASMLFEFDGELLHLRAWGGYDPGAAQDYLRQFPMRPNRGTAVGRVILDREVVHIRNIADDPEIAQSVRTMGVRSTLGIPLLRNGQPIGVIAIGSTTTGGFSDSQVELLKTFAEQAVIAIGSAETYGALQQRTRDLSESLEHQSAIAEVLQVINSSPENLAPVFDTILQKAMELCGVAFGSLYVTDDGNKFHFAAQRGFPEKYAAFRAAHLLTPAPGTPPAYLVATKGPVQVLDIKETDQFRARNPITVAMFELGGIRTILNVPLVKDGELRGVIAVYRQEVRAFSDKEIALLRNFAAQAVIAIENARLLTEQREALEQQTATAEVLQVINGSPGELAPVFEAMIDRAMRLCDAQSGGFLLYDGTLFHTFANRTSLATAGQPLRPEASLARLVAGEDVVHVADVRDTEEYRSGIPGRVRLVEQEGVRTALWVALRKERALLGAFLACRKEIRAFSEREIALIRNFAAQAVIAMENARLLTEQREALEQQTATAEVLGVINASPGNLIPVFDAMLEKAMHLCEAAFGILWAHEDGRFHAPALRGVPPAFAEFLRKPLGPFHPGSGLTRMLRGEDLIINEDMATEDAYWAGDALRRAIVDLGGARTAINVSLRKEQTLLGAITVFRQEVRPFSDKHIALLQNFAAQAVIAMEKAGLLSELRESLEQQTAMSDVLQAINASQGDATPVFDVILEKAHAVCGATIGSLGVFDGAFFRKLARYGYPPEMDAFLGRPYRPYQVHEPLFRGETVHVRDVQSSTDVHPLVKQTDMRVWLEVPLWKDGRLLGSISGWRTEPRPFSDKEVHLLENFAAQAVIAMENARLLTELRESLDQQTATAEVLKVINRSAFDLQTVLDTLVASAVRLCDASRGEVFVRDGDLFRIRAHAGSHLPELLDFLQQNPINIGRETVTGRVATTGEVHNIADILADAEYEFPGVMEHRALRSRLGVPLVRDGRVEGVLHLSREESQPFTPRQVELVSTFADQAVIALENARLFSAVQERTRELTESLQQQTATAEVLKVISRSAFDLQAVLETLIESAAKLCNAPEGLIYLREGDVLSVRAVTGVSNTLLQFIRENPHRVGSKSLAGRVLTTGAVVNVADIALDPDYDYPGILEHGGGTRPSGVGVPLLRNGRVEGVMTLGRPQALPFSPRQVELLATFADQAVIAIENARLFDEVQARTQELTQSVSELQALEEVLRAVNSSLDLQTVLSTIIGRAVQLSQADEGTIYEFDAVDNVFVPRAAFGMSEERVVQLREGRIRMGETYLGRSAIERVPIHVADVQQDASTLNAAALHPGIHAVLAIPLLREDKVVGGLVIRRRREGAFDEATVKLLQTFATQSVLAIANARLFDEVQARTKELTESLEIQSATADVLKAISRSAFDLEAVLDTLTRSAANLCVAATGIMHIREGENFRMGAMFGHNPGMVEYRKGSPLRPGRGSIAARAALTHQVEHILDIQADPKIDPEVKALTNNRTALAVPLLREDKLEGVFVLGRRRIDAFSQRQIELVQTFADQALIAIENARLFNEVQARTRELTKSLDDLRAAQDRLIQTEKLASLGQLTAGIAHEIKNPLNFVNNFSALSVDLIDELHTALTPVPLDAAVRAEVKEVTVLLRGNLEKVVQHGKRADGIVKNMLLHARETGGERRNVDLNTTVEEALNLAYHGARAEKPGFTITLQRNFDPAVGSVELYPQEFTRVMLNLFSNGFYAATRKAGEAVGVEFQPTLTVTTEARPNEVLIRVRDNGTGIPDEARARLFEPFFTTKPAGEGTGLGLSISHDIIVKQHSGSIAVDSRLDEYTEFTISLPRTSAGAPA